MNWITLHCSDTADSGTVSWEAIRRFHTAPPPAGRGWTDIGYHFGIEKVGDVYRIFDGRPVTENGAHVEGHNSGNLGVCLVGTFEHSAPTAAQWALALRLVRDLQVIHGVPVDRVRGHREWPDVTKTCPGAAFDLDRFRAELR